MAFVNIPLSTVDHRDTGAANRSPADKVKEDHAAVKLEAEERMQQSLNSNYQVTRSRIRDLRLQPWANGLKEAQVNRVLKDYFVSGHGKECPGHDSPDVQAELRAEPPSVAETPRDESSSSADTRREAPRDTFGSQPQNEAALARRPGADVFRPALPQAPTTPQKPVPQVPAPRTPTPTKIATAPLVPEAPLAHSDTPTPDGTPPRTPGTPVVAAPVVPKGKCILLHGGDKPPPGACHSQEAVVAHHEAGLIFRAKFGPSPDVAVPATLAQAAGTFVVGRMVSGRTSTISSKTSSSRSSGEARGSRTGDDREALALGFQRQATYRPA